MFKKKLAAITLALALVPTAAFAHPGHNHTTVVAAPTQAEIRVTYNTSAILFSDQKPVIKEGRTLVPIRPIAEALGFKVDWNNATRTVTIEKDTNKIALVVDQKTAKRNSDTLTLDVPAQIINSRTMLPVRFIAEALNYNVGWENTSRTVLVTDQVAETTQPTTPTTPQPSAGALIDTASVKGNLAKMLGMGMYKVSGKVVAGTKLSIEFDGATEDVKVNADGTFEFSKALKQDTLTTYKLKASKDGKEETFDGVFKTKVARL